MEKKNSFRLRFFWFATASFSAAVFLSSCIVGEKSPLEAVKDFQAEKYMGKWHEIARTPNPFEKDLFRVSAFYSLEKDGSVTVVNEGVLPDGGRKRITGKALSAGSKGEGLLKVTFFRPFYGEYRIVKLSGDYRYSVVVSGKKYLWILAREQTLSPKEKEEILSFLEKHSFDVSKLIWEEGNAVRKGEGFSPLP